MQRAAASIASTALRRIAAAARPAILGRPAGGASYLGQVVVSRRSNLSSSHQRLLSPTWEFSRGYARGIREATPNEDEDDDDDVDEDEVEPLDGEDLDGEWDEFDEEGDGSVDESD